MSQGSQIKRFTASDLLSDRDGTVSNKDARLYNVLIEKNNDELNVLKRPGHALYNDTVTGTGMGITPIVDSANSAQLMQVVSDVLYFGQSGGSSSVLLHLDGADGATSTTDAYSHATATFATGSQLSTTHAKFGTASLQMDAAVNPGTTTHGLKLTGITSLGSGSWTMDCWYYYASGGNVTSRMISAVNSADYAATSYGARLIWSSATATLSLDLSSNGTSWDIANAVNVTSVSLSIGWHHMALTFDAVAGHYYSYVDGVKKHDVTSASAVCAITTIFIVPSDYNGVLNQKGWIDEWRLVGFCLYPGGVTFTPPTTSATTGEVSAKISGVGSNASLVNGSTGAPVAGWKPSNLYDFSQTVDLTKIAIKNTAGAWQYTVATQALVQVNNANYPSKTTKGLVYLNTVFYVMDKSGVIYGSNPNDFTTWSALNFISAQSEPDPGRCIMKLNQYVVAFGQYTTEFFFDAGNATGSPLSSVQNGTLLIGCDVPDTCIGTESNIYFVGQSKGNGQSFSYGSSVYKMQGLSASKISTDSVERLINADGLSGAWANICTLLAHNFYVINMPTSGVSLAYDMSDGEWYFYTTRTLGNAQSVGAGNLTYTLQTDGNALVSLTLTGHGFSDGDPVIIAGATQTAYNGTWNVTRVDANTVTYVATSVPSATPATGTITAQGSSESNMPLLMPCQYAGLQVFQHKTDGKVYQIVDTTFTDNSVFIDSRIRTARVDGGANDPKFCAWMDVITDRTSANALVRFTDDDYQTYTKYRKVSLSGQRSRLNRQGTFTRRAWEVRHTDTSAWRFQGLDLGLEKGSE